MCCLMIVPVSIEKKRLIIGAREKTKRMQRTSRETVTGAYFAYSQFTPILVGLICCIQLTKDTGNVKTTLSIPNHKSF